jgi:cytochrome P450/NADPH-cytochrome P450 reductase
MNSPDVKSIPQPKPHFLLGNAPDIDPHNSVESMMRLARENGPIFRLKVPGSEFIVATSQAIVNELCDEQRFDKRLSRPLALQREVTGPTLFTSSTQEADWQRGHRILQPGFGALVLRSMFEPMWDIAEQLLLKWERLPEGTPIDVADDMTRLTLDTIALCGYGYRFNSFYSETLHPFVRAMMRQFRETSARLRRPALLTRLMILNERQRAEDTATMRGMADALLARHKQTGPRPGHKDLIDLMLTGRDPKTGEALSDTFIAGQIVGFLVAGHETTSGLLTFALYELLANPDCLAKAREEVDRVLGARTARFEDIARLTYIDQVLKESLRLWPTAPALSFYPIAEQETVGDGYQIRHDETVVVVLPSLHRDPAVWTDPERFDPERFTVEAMAKLPPNAWKPFGNGQRSCIGRPFAMQEAQLVLASVLQRFDIALADPGYTLRIKQELTIKPGGFFMKVKRRDIAIAPPIAPAAAQPAAASPVAEAAAGVALQVLFGSNSGASEAFAQRIANDASAQGVAATLAPLDAGLGKLSPAALVVIVAASYEGRPTDNAREFVDWLDTLGADALQGVRYAVLGCGNRDWTRTYQAIPKRIDEKLAAAGAERVMARGEADARGDFFGDFDAWYDRFRQHTGNAEAPPPVPRLMLEFVEGVRSPIIRLNQLQQGLVIDNHELVDTSSPFGRSKRHIEIALPEGMTYRAGDYLSVLPENPAENIGRALRRFHLPYDAQVILHPSPGLETVLPTNGPVMAGELLASYVDLGAPATRRDLAQLAESAADWSEMQRLKELASDPNYLGEVLGKRLSMLDLLERFPSCGLSLAEFLQSLPVLKPRQYSISSSPHWSEGHCSITVSVLDAPAWSGAGAYRGVASTYLARARPGMQIAVSVRPSQAGFHLPEDPAVPIIMLGAGTGMAPFRGFLQERAISAGPDQPFGEAHLFFGCNHPEVDFIYRDELRQWEANGLVKLHPAFHRIAEDGGEYVQHRLWADRAEIMPLMANGARIYVCGDGRQMAPAVRETFGRIRQEATGATGEQVEAWLLELEKSFRYTQDVFA